MKTPVGLKRVAACCLLLLLSCFLMEGCNSSWRKKFVRKRQKEVTTPQAYLVLQPDQKAVLPPDARYRQHYAFWKSWHGELLLSLGQIHKRDVRYLDGVIGELRAMRADLAGEPAGRLREILVELSNLRDDWESSRGVGPMPASHRTRLEKLQREIGKKFHYSEVKESIVQDSEPQPE